MRVRKFSGKPAGFYTGLKESYTHFIYGEGSPQHPRATAITFEFGRHNDTYTKVPQHPKIPNPFSVKLKK